MPSSSSSLPHLLRNPRVQVKLVDWAVLGNTDRQHGPLSCPGRVHGGMDPWSITSIGTVYVRYRSSPSHGSI